MKKRRTAIGVVMLLVCAVVLVVWWQETSTRLQYEPYRVVHPEVTKDALAGIEAIASGEYPADAPVYDTFYAAIYDQLYVEGRQWFLTQHVIERLSREGPGRLRVLDAGCGTGNEVRILSRLHEMSCVDSSPAMLRIARLKSPTASFVEGDFRDGSLFPEGRFDALTSFYSPIFYTEDYREPLRNFHRWLVPGGLLFIDLMDRRAFPNREAWYSSDKHFGLGPYRVDRYGVWAVHEGEHVTYDETFFVDGEEVYRQSHHMFYPTYQEFVATVTALGFELEAKHSLARVDDQDEILFVFRKADNLSAAK